jgi:hypothetical protein
LFVQPVPAEIGFVCTPRCRPRQIGFVWHNRPSALRRLGVLARHPPGGTTGFVSHGCPSSLVPRVWSRPAGPGNWVRFAQFVLRALANRRELALFRTTGSTHAPSPRYPSPPKFGFVLHFTLHTSNLKLLRNWLCFAHFALRGAGLSAAAPNWVRFAQSARAGRRRQAAGQASRRQSVPNPQSAI